MRHSTWTAPVGFRFGFRKRTQMPLAKMAGCVTMLLQQLRQSQLLRLHVAGIGKVHPVPVRVAAGNTAASGGTAHGRSGIEALKSQAALGHGIQVRGLDYLVAIKTHIAPAQIIAHHQYDIGPIGCRYEQGQDCED